MKASGAQALADAAALHTLTLNLMANQLDHSGAQALAALKDAAGCTANLNLNLRYLKLETVVCSCVQHRRPSCKSLQG